MAEMNGYRVTAVSRERDSFIPIIVITALTVADDKKEYEKMGLQNV